MSAYSAVEAIPVSERAVDVRAAFIAKTYVHLMGAIVGFTLLEIGLFTSGAAYGISRTLMSVPWAAVLGAYMIVGWLATHTAAQARSLAVQYLALAAFVAAEAIIFMPLLYMADVVAPGVIQSAAFVTLAAFTGLTAIAFLTRKDFSFLGAILYWVGICAMVAIAGSLIFGMVLGTWFSVAMVAFAGGAVLYDTSNVLHHYPEDRYVSASLQLFASVALMFWYVLRLMSSRR